MKKRILAWILSLSMCVVVLTGCSDGTEQRNGNSSTPVASSKAESSQTKDTEAVKSYTYLRDLVTVSASKDNGSFNPFSITGFGAVELGLFQKLAYEDSEGKLRLCGLKSYEKRDDLTYELELWDCIYDSAGNHITAEDVKWSVEHFISVGHAGKVHRLDRLEVSGEYTLTWHSNAPMGLGDLEQNLSNVTVVSRTAWESVGTDEMATNPIGTGPYVLKEYVPTSHITLEANETFWMKNIVDEEWLAENDYALNYQNVKTIQIEILQDEASRAVAVEMGIVDIADSVNAADVNVYAADAASGVVGVNKFVQSPVSWYYNCSELSPCADINLRKAICYAIDNASIALGLSCPAYPVYGLQPNVCDAPESWLSGRAYYDYDPETAAELVSQSDYDGEALILVYRSSVQAFEDACVQMQFALKEVGIKLELLPVKDSQMDEYTANLSKWDLVMDTFADGNYCESTLNRYWTENSAATRNGLQVTGIVDKMLDELYVALKKDNSVENIEAWDSYFNEQCYGYAVCGYYNQTACRDYVCAVVVGSRLVPGAFTYND